MDDELLTRILITQGTHPFAQRLARSLPGFDRYFGMTDPHSPLLQTGRYIIVPRADSPSFVHGLLRDCLDRQIRLLIPLGERELMPLAQAAPLFSEYGIDILLPRSADISDFPVFTDPGRGQEPVVLCDGRNISASPDIVIEGNISGVFIGSDDGGELALCCVTDE